MVGEMISRHSRVQIALGPLVQIALRLGTAVVWV